MLSFSAKIVSGIMTRIWPRGCCALQFMSTCRPSFVDPRIWAAETQISDTNGALYHCSAPPQRLAALFHRIVTDCGTPNAGAGAGSGTMAGGRPMNMAPQGMGPGPGGPRAMGSGSLGMGAMNNSLMPGGGMGVSTKCDIPLELYWCILQV